MLKVKASAATSEKWLRRTSSAGEEYAQGVANPRTPWKEATAAATGRWAEGVQAAITQKRFDKGVAKATNESWSSGAINKGVSRFGPGVANSTEKYNAAVSPYLSTIATTDIGPRFPKGDPRNIDRVRKLALALHAKKVT